MRLVPLRWLLAGALGLALGLAACSDNDDQVTTDSVATLSGDQEVPMVPTGALGSGTLSFDSPSRNIRGSITLDGMTANAAHIHEGAVGVNGPVIVTLNQTSPGVWTVPSGSVLTEAQAALLAAGGLYFNAHSTAHPGGEVRGQIGREVHGALLSPRQEVPPPPSTASGTGWLSLDPATRRFSARITLTGLTATMAHIHQGAAGINGPIVFDLTQTAPGSGVWVTAADATMTDAQLATLRSGGFYFNAHSTAFPGGEVRGQIGRYATLARMTAAEEVPPTTSVATGTGTVVIEPLTRMVTGSVTLSGMTATMAHIHQGAAGVNGPIIVTLANTSPNVWSVPANTRLTAEQVRAFREGNLYFNAHSTEFPGGEVRGQLR